MAANDGGAVALVTGAGRGIGFGASRQLAERGMTVLLEVRTLEKGEAAAREPASEGLDVRTRAVDVCDGESVGRLAAALESEFGVVDVLVNNAAAFGDLPETAPTADIGSTRGVFETNLFGAWRVCQAFVPLVRRSAHGRIVNVSSGAGSHGDTDFGLTTNRGSVASYGISKAAINALTSKLAAELEGTGILVNSACPGLTATAPGMEATRVRSRTGPRASSGRPRSPTTAGPAAFSARASLEEDFAKLRLPGGDAVEVFGPSRAGQEQFAAGPVVGFRIGDVRSARGDGGREGRVHRPGARRHSGRRVYPHFRGPNDTTYEIVQLPDDDTAR